MKLHTKLIDASVASLKERRRRTKLYRAWRKRHKKVARQQRKWNRQHG